jgi:hypothetical protein
MGSGVRAEARGEVGWRKVVAVLLRRRWKIPRKTEFARALAALGSHKSSTPSTPKEERSGGEQQDLAWRMRSRAGRSAGAVKDAGDVVGVGHDIEDTHATAALAADGDVDGEHTGEEAGPADAARSGGGVGGGAS